MKLTFPWLSDDYVSDWARTVQPGAGKDRGAMVLPEVGDEVLVAFEQGDIRRPYVLGGLYNGIDTPDRPAPIDDVDGGSGAVNRRSMVSRRGHRIDLLDEDGRTEGITLSPPATKLTLTMDSVGTKITVHSDGKRADRGQGRRHRRRRQREAGTQGRRGLDHRHQRASRSTAARRVRSKVNGRRQARGQRRRARATVRQPGQDQLATARAKERDRCHQQHGSGDPTGHPGVIGPPGVPTVLIAGMPAATVGTPHICSFPPPAVHPPTAIVPPGCPTVLIGGLPAARMGDMAACGAPIVIGAPTVLIGG